MNERARGDLLACLRAGLAAVDPERLVRSALASEPIPLPAGRLRLVAIGKGARRMARGVLAELRPPRCEGVIVQVGHVPGDLPVAVEGIREAEGAHPVPDVRSVEAGRAVRELVAGAAPDDLVLVLISGGASAAVVQPVPGLSLDDIARTTELLLASGADIGAVNAVRKHVDELKGGGLALAAGEAPVRAFVLSDVVGDRLDVVGSGPTVGDPTTFGQAVRALRRYRVWDRVPDAVRQRLLAGQGGALPETPEEGDPRLRRASTRLVGGNRSALAAIAEEAGRRGYGAAVLTGRMVGEAREVGRLLASIVRESVENERAEEDRSVCFLAGGETTVEVTGAGRGGRNLEVALGAAQALDGLPGVIFGAFASDGVDGPTDAAGAIVDGSTLARAAGLGLDPVVALAENDTLPFFESLGDVVRTGPTGTNVMDLVIALAGDPRAS